MTQTARIYGGSLYDLAAEEQLTEVILEQMKTIRALFQEEADYVSLLTEPSIPRETRIGMIEDAFGQQAEKYLVNFIKLLCEKGILREYAGCCEEFIRRYNADHNIVEAIVTSAVPLSEAQLAGLKARLEKMSRKTVQIIWKKAPVIGGIRVEMDGKLLDGTLSGRIDELTRRLGGVTI